MYRLTALQIARLNTILMIWKVRARQGDGYFSQEILVEFGREMQEVNRMIPGFYTTKFHSYGDYSLLKVRKSSCDDLEQALSNVVNVSAYD